MPRARISETDAHHVYYYAQARSVKAQILMPGAQRLQLRGHP